MRTLELEEAREDPGARDDGQAREDGPRMAHSLDQSSLDGISSVPVQLSAVLGRTVVSAAELLELKAGSVLLLDRKLGQAIDIYVNNRMVARGELVISDERLGITMTEMVKNLDR